MESMETYCCFCTLLNVNTSSHSISLGVVLVPHFVTSSTLKRLGQRAVKKLEFTVLSYLIALKFRIPETTPIEYE
jgi:hypothetical protein